MSLGLAVLVLAVLLSTSVLAADGTVHWSGTFTHPNNNTVTTAPLPADPTSVTQVWSKPVGNNTVVIVGDYLYTYEGNREDDWGDCYPVFYKINKNTGEVVKSTSCDVATGNYYSYSIYANGRIYVGTEGYILAFDPDTMQQVWKKARNEQDKSYGTLQYIGGHIVSNGTVLKDNGTSATTQTISGIDFGSGWANGAEVGGYYYVADIHENVHAISTTTWKVVDTVSSGVTANTSDSKNDPCPGVLYENGALYWGGVSGNAYRVEVSGGTFADSTFKKVSCGIKCYGAPVAANGRVYLAGVQSNEAEDNTGKSTICVFDAATMNRIYQASSTENGKIQSTPILQKVSNTTVRVYVQGYNKPGRIYYLQDTTTAQSGSLTLLLEPSESQYAFEQLACDNDGALYCTNNSGYLMKYQANGPTASGAPVITKDLSTDPVYYELDAKASALTITASGSGTLSYQWQSGTDGKTFLNISGATTASLTPAVNKAGTTYYRCVVHNDHGQAVSAVAVISVTGLRGDIVADGVVDNKDIDYLSRYLVGLEVNCSQAAADVNSDGEIDLVDLILLRRHLEWYMPLSVLQSN